MESTSKFPRVEAVLDLLKEANPNPEMLESFVLESIATYAKMMQKIRIPVDTPMDSNKAELIKWRDISKHVHEKMEILHANLPENLQGDQATNQG